MRLPDRMASVLAAVLLLGSGLAPGARAQGTLGTIRGVVLDPSGAVVPGVILTVTNESTTISTTARTNETGNYEVVNLIPGSYTVLAEVAGFKRVENKRVNLPVTGLVRVDITLEVGSAATEVTVRERGASLETDTANIYGFRSERQIKDLPFNVRTRPGTVSRP